MADVCRFCGILSTKTQSLKLCARCKTACYCSKEHQVSDWKEHKKQCRKQEAPEKPVDQHNACDGTPLTVVEIKSGQGNGLSNKMIEHQLDKRGDLESFIRKRFGGLSPIKLKSEFSEFFGLKLDVFFDPRENSFTADGYSGNDFNLSLSTNLNAAGIFLTINLITGFSPYINMNGTVFVCSQNPHRQQVSKDALTNILKMIARAQSTIYCNEDYHDPAKLLAVLKKWKNEANFNFKDD